MPRATRTAAAPAPRAAAPIIEAPAVRDTARATSGRTVTIACKLPNGLILQLFRKMVVQEMTREGPKDVTTYDRDGEQVIIAGPAYPVIPPVGYPRQVMVEGGFAFTRGVSAKFWEQWSEQNKDNPLVRNGHIFASSAIEDLTAQAREKEKMQTGFQPLDMREDGKYERRMPKSAHGITFKHDPRNAAAE